MRAQDDLGAWYFRYSPWFSGLSTLMFVAGLAFFAFGQNTGNVWQALFGLFFVGLGGPNVGLQHANFVRQRIEGRIADLERRLELEKS